jgi:hypothetical protein
MDAIVSALLVVVLCLVHNAYIVYVLSILDCIYGLLCIVYS